MAGAGEKKKTCSACLDSGFWHLSVVEVDNLFSVFDFVLVKAVRARRLEFALPSALAWKGWCCLCWSRFVRCAPRLFGDVVVVVGGEDET